MKIKIFVLMLSVFVLTGCATMRGNPNAVQTGTLQTKVANLEEQSAARDQEIVALRSDVDSLRESVESQSDRASRDNNSYRRVDNAPVSESNVSKSTSESSISDSGDDRVIRVDVSANKVQKALKNAGYYNGNIDGKVGEQTKAGIRDFQKAHDLKADGIVGKATWTALKSYVE